MYILYSKLIYFQVYIDGVSEGDCVYHPGAPIFHEGMKFWSCCQRKTSDFQSFLNQVGCTEGKHQWIKIQVRI